MKLTHIIRYFLVFLLSLLTWTVSTTLAGAQTAPAHVTFKVNTTADTHDVQPGDGKCADQNGQCSLRAAIEEADALPHGSSITITMPAGMYKLTLGTLGLTAHRTITINGASSKSVIIDSNEKFRVMFISVNVSAHLNQLTIKNGNDGNTGQGGGIYNQGTLTMSNSILSGNLASYGGGIYNGSGSVAVSNSTLDNNSATTGSGIYNQGMLTVSNCILSNNKADAGGVVFTYINGIVAITATIVANNTDSNCFRPITDGGYNLDSGTSCGFTRFPLNNTDPMLGPLGNNGGPTRTMALRLGSPAIDYVIGGDCPATDQRGQPRPDNSESTCDIGAYESVY